MEKPRKEMTNINGFFYKNNRDRWLNQNGGRLQSDILQDVQGREYVYMGDGNGYEIKVYLPINIQRLSTYTGKKEVIMYGYR